MSVADPGPTVRRPLLSPIEVHEAYGLHPEALRALRRRGEGPAVYRIGSRWMYSPDDVEAWLESCRQVPVPARPDPRRTPDVFDD